MNDGFDSELGSVVRCGLATSDDGKLAHCSHSKTRLAVRLEPEKGLAIRELTPS